MPEKNWIAMVGVTPAFAQMLWGAMLPPDRAVTLGRRLSRRERRIIFGWLFRQGRTWSRGRKVWL